MTQKKHNLNYEEAMLALRNGHAVRLPEWTGYWFPEGEKIKVLTRTGDILTTPDYDNFRIRNDWEVVTEGLGFDFALLALLDGKLLRRSGWNGSGQFVFVRPEDKLAVDMITEKVKSLPASLKQYFKSGVERLSNRLKSEKERAKSNDPNSDNRAEVIGSSGPEFNEDQKIQFTAYFCLKNAQGDIVNGWIPSTGDLMSRDWEVLR